MTRSILLASVSFAFLAVGVSAGFVSTPVFAADVTPYPEPTDPPDPPQACVPPNPASITVKESLVIHDKATLGAGFEFSKTIGAILRSAGMVDDQAAKEAFVRTLLDTLNIPEATNDGLRMVVKPRPAEFALVANDLLDPNKETGLVSTGLFNRIDLAPQSFSDCGEYRIVYSFKKPITLPSNTLPARFFLIFEAKLPNPDALPKSAGQKADPKACMAVAKFWSGLTGLSPADRNSKLQQFYYSGLPGVVGPVVTANNYGDILGQVRSNQFVEEPWLLREWRVRTGKAADGSNSASFNVDTVKSNPLAELYLAKTGENNKLETVKAAFQSELLATYVKEIVTVDSKSGGNAEAIINGFAIKSDLSKFNEFQSAEDETDLLNPDTALVTAIGSAIPSTVRVSKEELVNRLNAISCQGCHQTAAGKKVGKDSAGNDIIWPKTLGFGFVHISEPDNDGSSVLSPALENSFLPARLKNLVTGHCIDPNSVAPLPSNPANATLADLAASIAVVQGAEAAPSVGDAQEIETAREAIQAASENEPGFFVETRRPH